VSNTTLAQPGGFTPTTFVNPAAQFVYVPRAAEVTWTCAVQDS